MVAASSTSSRTNLEDALAKASEEDTKVILTKMLAEAKAEGGRVEYWCI
jgi:hypothetical protein